MLVALCLAILTPTTRAYSLFDTNSEPLTWGRLGRGIGGIMFEEEGEPTPEAGSGGSTGVTEDHNATNATLPSPQPSPSPSLAEKMGAIASAEADTLRDLQQLMRFQNQVRALTDKVAELHLADDATKLEMQKLKHELSELGAELQATRDTCDRKAHANTGRYTPTGESECDSDGIYRLPTCQLKACSSYGWRECPSAAPNGDVCVLADALCAAKDAFPQQTQAGVRSGYGHSDGPRSS
eukprot:5493581-Prymnesium_polylepis.1